MAVDANPRETLWELIKDIRFAMITHQHPDGQLHACPMTTANKEGMKEDQNLYFLVSKTSDLAHCVAQHPQINLAYADTDNDSYVSISARAHLSEDMALKEELFSAMAKAWFPGGVEDPQLAILVARAEQAEYWDVQQSKLVQLFAMAKSAVTGNKPDAMGHHQHVPL
ncbi:MAG: pyridoxamine 5'-phosphate oxidase family protein [Comamonas sp.]|nr:pyridoxamine 5'-phosphate oxidase family protein [Comamonas sp.]